MAYNSPSDLGDTTSSTLLRQAYSRSQLCCWLQHSAVTRVNSARPLNKLAFDTFSRAICAQSLADCMGDLIYSDLLVVPHIQTHAVTEHPGLCNIELNMGVVAGWHPASWPQPRATTQDEYDM